MEAIDIAKSMLYSLVYENESDFSWDEWLV